MRLLSLQPDGRILVGGYFTTLGGQSRTYFGRINTDGTLDPDFNPAPNNLVRSLALQPDGKILAGGYFGTLGGQTRNCIGRINANGTGDTSFIGGGAIGAVFSLALKGDGKILAGGAFSLLDGQSHNKIGRLNSDGTGDTSFNPAANDSVYSLAEQADGKILVAGVFATLGGQLHRGIGRLNLDGTMDTNFNPVVGGAYPNVTSLAVQTDGKIVVGGQFTRLGGQTRNYIGRLNSDGTLDTSFDPGAGSIVYSVALQARERGRSRYFLLYYATWP